MPLSLLSSVEGQSTSHSSKAALTGIVPKPLKA